MGVEYGTLIGVGVDLVILLYPTARPGMEVIHPKIPNNRTYDDSQPEADEEAQKVSDIVRNRNYYTNFFLTRPMDIQYTNNKDYRQ